MDSNKHLPQPLTEQLELDITCCLNKREASSRSNCYTGEALLTKQFRLEIAVCSSQERSCGPLSTTVCRKCRDALLHEISLTLPWLGREGKRQQVDFLLKHRPRDKASTFRVIALIGGPNRELCLPREEESCPLCKFALSPFDRASSLSEQSLSRSFEHRVSPPSSRREPYRKQYQTGDAPFAAQVTPQGDVIQRKPRPVCARPDFITPSDLQVKTSRSQEGTGLHRHVSLTVSNYKYSPLSPCYANRSKSTGHSHRTRTSYIEEDCLHTLKKGFLMTKHKSRLSSSQSTRDYSTMHASQPAHVKSCRVM